MTELNSFKKGIADGIPICLGYLAVSFAFGISAVSGGFSVFEALLMSMANVTSAGQLAAVPIIASYGTFAELAVTQLVINLRYSLMSVSLSQKLGKSVSLADRFLISFVNTDEVFAVASAQRGTVGRKYLFGLILTPYVGWSVGTLAGAAAGNVLPAILISALGLAIYGMFVAIVVPDARRERAVALCAVFSAVLSCIFRYTPALSRIPSGFVIIICAVFASALFAAFCPIKTEESEEHDA
ncbi:MAG: AzlC family ABC transporter permease [Clostridia bacterium]|nr:AzlC family ABC transporter permease [Clostridia bacterium]